MKNINLTLERGKKYCFVGDYGSGKSTLSELLQRYYDITSGSITIDGRDIKSYNLAWLRRQFGFIDKDPVLFDGTLKENISYFKQDASEFEVYEALEIAQAS